MVVSMLFLSFLQFELIHLLLILNLCAVNSTFNGESGLFTAEVWTAHSTECDANSNIDCSRASITNQWTRDQCFYSAA